jgi:drug/metabolite transporter (DMT)-like permease
MLPAFLTTIFFSISVICASRSAKLIGGTEANFWRLTFAAIFLSIWAWTFGKGLSGEGFPVFLLSGIVGIGVGDVALFQTLPRLGSRLTLVVVQCLTAPFAAAIEWLWLGTKLSAGEMACGAIILIGIGISLAPDKKLNLPRRTLITGILFGLAAAGGNAFGAVLSRKGYAVLKAHDEYLDGGTTAYQRVIGGLAVAGICLLVVKWREVKGHLVLSGENPTLPSREKWRRLWPWVLANSLAGQTIGVSCYQWAFRTTPTGVVLPIVAMTPLVAIPFSLVMENERPSMRSIIGGLIAVSGVVGLSLLK